MKTTDSLILQVKEFHCDPQADQKFANWFARSISNVSYFRQLCQTNFCCQILKMVEASDKNALEDIVNECITLDSGMTQHESDEHDYIDQISNGTMCRKVSTLRKTN
ncbi:hypothetical protein ACTXT7_003079 [Hymenolepis weldensis]